VPIKDLSNHRLSSAVVAARRAHARAMNDYPDIADHGLIGDLQTAALVAGDGTIDWFCCPRFDSPSVFASLLDRERGGRFRIAPVVDDGVTKQLYFPDSANLITRFMTPDGVGEVIDFMPVIEGTQPTPHHSIIRLVRVVRGELRFALECEPRFDYGRGEHQLEVADGGAIFHGRDLDLVLSCTAPLQARGRDVRAELTLKEGESAAAHLESAGHTGPRTLRRDEMIRRFEDNVRFWRRWLERCTYHGRWWDMVRRSAITLKLMTYAPTGGLVAAPTAGLPEQVGGVRNWDYRFTWVRDASLSVHALLGLGFQEEAASFMLWLNDRANEQFDGASGPLKIMYRVDGSSDLTEETLDHLEGYRGSRPVRVGNAAADQLQLDIYGEMVDALYKADRNRLQIGYEGWTALRRLIDWVAANWDQPEEGIWETRGGRRDFVYGRVMCWVALDRAIRIAMEHGNPADLEVLREVRDRIYGQVMERGWNPRVHAFSQYYGSDVLDASLLLMPLVGFVVPTDRRWISTIEAMKRELVSDSLVYRYNPSASPDGLPGSEGTFSLCTFLYVDALARSGYIEEARWTFEKMLTYGNHVGLFSEEIGPTGEQLGNFPQAFTHLALINAAISLDQAVEGGGGVDALRERVGRMLAEQQAQGVPASG
jgi:GH15 family glucan-1,4-alpha-glucosidase